MNWIFCWLPFDSCSARRSAYSGMRKRSSQSRVSRSAALGFHAVQLGEEDELVEDLHLGVEAPLLRQVAPGLVREIPVRAAAPGNRPGVRPQDVQHDAHGRRLAGAVGAQEAEDLARLDLERDALEGLDLAEALGHRVDDEGH